MTDWIKTVIGDLGYAAIVGLMFIENVFPPIPSELIMPFAGFMAAKGVYMFAGVVMAGVLGSVLGALPLYYLGDCMGEQRLKAWARRYGRWVAVSEGDVDKANSWFDKHGGKAVFFCRLVPGVRSLISIPAGSTGMNMTAFLTYTTLGTGLWTLLLASLGWLLGRQYERVSTYLGPVSYVVLGALAVAGITWVVKRRRESREDSD